MEGYEHNEIATIVGCSIGNSKSQLHKARMKLRDLLKMKRAEKAEILSSAQRGGTSFEATGQVSTTLNRRRLDTGSNFGQGRKAAQTDLKID